MKNRNDILIFYNKSTGEKIGYYSVYATIVQDIRFAELFTDNYLKIDKVLDDIFDTSLSDNYYHKLKKYFVGVSRENIGTKYIDYNLYERKHKINKINGLIK